MGSNLSPSENEECSTTSTTTCVICRQSFGHPKLLQSHLASHLTGVPLLASSSASSSSSSCSPHRRVFEDDTIRHGSSKSNNHNLLSSSGTSTASPRLLSPISPLSESSSNHATNAVESDGIVRNRNQDGSSMCHIPMGKHSPADDYGIRNNNHSNNNNNNHESDPYDNDSDSNQTMLMMMKAKPEILPCAFCPTVFTDMNGLAKHIAIAHRNLTTDIKSTAGQNLQSALRLFKGSGVNFPIPQHI